MSYTHPGSAWLDRGGHHAGHGGLYGIHSCRRDVHDDIAVYRIAALAGSTTPRRTSRSIEEGVSSFRPVHILFLPVFSFVIEQSFDKRV